MKCHYLFIHFLTVGVVANTVQIAAANENNGLRLGYLANEASSISAIGKANQPDLQPAKIFVPHLDEIQESIPSDLILRLPSQIAGDDTLDGMPLEESTYTVRVFSFDSPSSLMVGLYRCNDGSPSCLINSFSVDRQSSTTAQNTLQHHQATGIPTDLTGNIQGYLLEEYQSGSLQPSVSIVWEQDGMIYTVSSLVSEQQNVVDMAQSMANAAPIGSPASTQMLPSKDEPLFENSESPDIDTNAISENAGEDLSESQLTVPIDLPSDLSSDLTPSDQNSTMVPSVSSNSSTESLDTSSDNTPLSGTELVQAQGQVALDQPPRPLPNELEIDESGGQFPLGVIRPIPVLSISSSFSIFTNNNLHTIPLTESTAFPISASLIFSPELGDRTRLVTSVGGNYTNFTTADDYILLNAGLGIFQDLGDQMSLGVGWSYQQTYGDGFKNDVSEHTAYLSWSRVDELVERRLFLDSDYFLSASFAQDEQQNRLINSVGLGLSYSFTPKFQGRLGYRLVYESFFENEDALRHQLSAQLSYQLNPNIFIGTSVSYLFGEQVDLFDTDGADAVNNVSFGLHFGVNLPLLY